MTQKFSRFYLIGILLFISLTSIVFAQDVDTTGNVSKTYYPDGKIKTMGTYWNNQLHGDYFEFYPNGKVWKKWHYFEGKEEGIQTWYFPYFFIRFSYTGIILNLRNTFR